MNSWYRFFDVMNMLVISKSFSGTSPDHFLKQNTHRQASIIYYEGGKKLVFSSQDIFSFFNQLWRIKYGLQ